MGAAGEPNHLSTSGHFPLLWVGGVGCCRRGQRGAPKGRLCAACRRRFRIWLAPSLLSSFLFASDETSHSGHACGHLAARRRAKGVTSRSLCARHRAGCRRATKSARWQHSAELWLHCTALCDLRCSAVHLRAARTTRRRVFAQPTCEPPSSLSPHFRPPEKRPTGGRPQGSLYARHEVGCRQLASRREDTQTDRQTDIGERPGRA